MKMKIQIPTDRVNTTMVADVVLETKVALNLISSSIHSKGGVMIIEVPEVSYSIVEHGFKRRGASVIPLQVPIKRDEDACIDCGACISVCPSRVYSFDKDWALHMEIEKCTGCGLCIKMCPHSALKIPEME